MANNDTVLATIGGMAYRLQYEQKHGTAEKAEEIYDCLTAFIEDTAPSGSGFDCGTKLISVTPQKLVLNTDFHHLNDDGFYDGWTHHKVIITAAFDSYDMRITGHNKNNIKEYIGDVFTEWLGTKLCEVMDSRYQNCYFNYRLCQWENQGNNA